MDAHDSQPLTTFRSPYRHHEYLNPNPVCLTQRPRETETPAKERAHLARGLRGQRAKDYRAGYRAGHVAGTRGWLRLLRALERNLSRA